MYTYIYRIYIHTYGTATSFSSMFWTTILIVKKGNNANVFVFLNVNTEFYDARVCAVA